MTNTMALLTERLDKLPPTVYYVPNFISEVEETDILKNVYDAPKPKWTCLSNRKLQNWGGHPHSKGMIAEDIPQWLQNYMKKVAKVAFPEDKAPNHVLVNEYLAGQGILCHLDGPIFYPIISTLTCGSHTVLNFYPEMDPLNIIQKIATTSLLLERRSLVVIQDDMYHKYPHSIEEVSEDLISEHIANLKQCSSNVKVGDRLTRSTRISLSIRCVPQTTKFKLNLGKFDPGWNDPPKFSYDQASAIQAAASKRGPGLNKRIAFPMSGSVASPQNIVNDPTLPPSTDISNIGTPPSTSYMRPANLCADSPGLSNVGTPPSASYMQPATADSTETGSLDDVLRNLAIVKYDEQIGKRIKIMENMWRENKFDASIQSRLLLLSEAISKGDVDVANSVQKSLMVDYSTQCSAWMSGVRHIINSLQPLPAATEETE